MQVLVCQRRLRSVADSLTNSAATSVETAGGNTLNQELVKPISRFAQCKGVQPLGTSQRVFSFCLLQKTETVEVNTEEEKKGSRIFTTLSVDLQTLSLELIKLLYMTLHEKTCCLCICRKIFTSCE